MSWGPPRGSRERRNQAFFLREWRNQAFFLRDVDKGNDSQPGPTSKRNELCGRSEQENLRFGVCERSEHENLGIKQGKRRTIKGKGQYDQESHFS